MPDAGDEMEKLYAHAQAELVEGARMPLPGQTVAQSVMRRMVLEENEFLSGIFKKYIPGFVIALANRPLGNPIGMLGRFLVELIRNVHGLEVQHHLDHGLEMGKGFRPGHDISTLRAVRIKVLKRGKLVAEKSIGLNLIIKK